MQEVALQHSEQRIRPDEKVAMLWDALELIEENTHTYEYANKKATETMGRFRKEGWHLPGDVQDSLKAGRRAEQRIQPETDEGYKIYKLEAALKLTKDSLERRTNKLLEVTGAESVGAAMKLGGLRS
jgi:hypothetical protein